MIAKALFGNIKGRKMKTENVAKRKQKSKQDSRRETGLAKMQCAYTYMCSGKEELMQ